VALEPGRIQLRGVSRHFRVLHDRNLTLKETALRRRRTTATQKWALREVDLDVEPGQSIGIIGQNGSGKSTLLKLLAGIIPPQAGTVELGGTIASMLELGAGFHPDFTGRENVYMNAAILGLSEKTVDKRFDEIVDFAEIEDFIDMPVRTYSSGMTMRLAFSISSHVRPDVLLLDEVLAVGDEAFQRKCFGRIFEFRRGGGTLVFVSHDPGAVERVCDRAILLEDGRIVDDGSTADVLATYHRRLAGDGRPAPKVVPAATEPVDAEEVDDADEPEVEDDPRVWGNGEVVIRASRLIGKDGPTDRFISGEPFTIEMEIEATTPVATPIVGVGIYSVDGPLFFGTNTRLDALEIPGIESGAVVRFAIPALPLHDGRFTVQMAVVSFDESVVYHWLDRWLEFSVFPTVTGVGPVAMSGGWTVDADEHPHGSRTASLATGDLNSEL
jgi:ABC-type polysaccharide/polyol phosphate transport system ATPase subunit